MITEYLTVNNLMNLTDRRFFKQLQSSIVYSDTED